MRGNCCVTSGRYGTPALVLWRATTMKYSKSFLSCNSIRSLSKVRYRPVCLSMDWTETSLWLWAEGERNTFHANTCMSCMHIWESLWGPSYQTAVTCVCIFDVSYTGEQKKTLIWIFVHVVLICKGWNYRDTKRFHPQHPIQHAAAVCVRTHLLFSPFSFSSVSLSDSLFSSVTKLKRRKEWKRKTEREETANNNHRKLRAHGIRPHCSHSCDCHTTHCPVLLKYGSVSTYPRM